MKTPDQLSRARLESIVGAIQAILWLDPRTGGFDPEKEWSSDTIEGVAAELDAAGLKPGDAAAPADPSPAVATPRDACTALIATIEATGGCVRNDDAALAPLGDPDWTDLADAYQTACAALGRTPMVEEREDDR